MFRDYYPHQVVSTALQFDVDAVRRSGITVLAFTIDNTLIVPGESELGQTTKTFLEDLRAQDFKLVMVADALRDYARLTRPLGAEEIKTFRNKTRNRGSLLRSIGAVLGLKDRGQIAVIGNSLFRDIVPANRLGMYTILVTPIAPDPKTLRYRHIRRIREALVLRLLGVSRPKPMVRFYR